MLENWTKYIPSDLIKSFGRIELPVVFIGSGFGKEAIPPLKTGGELASDLRDELRIDDGGEGLAELLQYFQNSLAGNKSNVIAWLKEKLLYNESKPGGAYRLLLELPCKEFLTTNYDLLLTDSSHEIKDYHLEAIDDPKSYKEGRDEIRRGSGRPILGRLHGAFTNETRIVATTDDYISSYTHEKEKLWREVLEQILSNNKVIFIGYSMRDFTTWTSYISMYVRWGGNRFPHVMVAPLSSHHISAFWGKYGVQYIPLKAHEFLIAVHYLLGTLEAKESVTHAAAAACLGQAQSDILPQLESIKDGHKYPDLKLAALKVVMEKANGTL